MKNILSTIRNILCRGLRWRPVSELPQHDLNLLFKVNMGNDFVYYVGGTLDFLPYGLPDYLIDDIDGFIEIEP
jgi:hypothetical protein